MGPISVKMGPIYGFGRTALTYRGGVNFFLLPLKVIAKLVGAARFELATPGPPDRDAMFFWSLAVSRDPFLSLYIRIYPALCTRAF